MTKLHPCALVLVLMAGTGCSGGGTHVLGSGGNAATGGAQGDGGAATATGGTVVGGSGGAGSGGLHGTGGAGTGGRPDGSGGSGGDGSASGGQAGSALDASTDAAMDAADDATLDAAPDVQDSGFTAVLAVFKKRCTECHAAGAIAPGMPKLHLTADVAYNSLVGKPAEETCGGTLVVPSDSAKSYLFRKIVDAASCDGVQMPMAYEGRFMPLATADVDTIRRWIDQGAAP